MPRIFTLSGPYTPAHYALARFIRAALTGQTIIVEPRQTFRSYVLAAELADWALACAPDPSALYAPDVSGPEVIEMGDLARKVRTVLAANVAIKRSIQLGEADTYGRGKPFGVTPLDDQIRRTAEWMKGEL
jgi:nucleoside-diphosphate-sugar epimerase